MTARDKWSRQKGANRATLDSHTRAVKVTQSLKSPLPPVISVCTRAQCEHISGKHGMERQQGEFRLPGAGKALPLQGFVLKDEEGKRED